VTKKSHAPRGFVALYPSVSISDVRCDYEEVINATLGEIQRCGMRALFICARTTRQFCPEHVHTPRANSCCRKMTSSDVRNTGPLLLHGDHHPTIFATSKTAEIYARVGGQGSKGEIREFDVDYLPVAHVDLQQRAEAYERLAMEWMERARQVIELMRAGQSHAPAPTERPRRERRKPGPRRVRCAECGTLNPPGAHDPDMCRLRRLPRSQRGTA
jgi:hypothetical protein